MWKNLQQLLDRLDSRISLYVSLGGGAVVSAITAYLASGVSWINNNLGMFGWWMAALLALLITSGILAMVVWAIGKISFISSVKKWSVQTENINPLDLEFVKRRIKISDLCHPFDKIISGRNFTDCELIGHANIILFGGSKAFNVTFVDCEAVVFKDVVKVQNAVGFRACNFVRGQIIGCTVLVPRSQVNSFIRETGLIPITLTGDSDLDGDSFQKGKVSSGGD